MPVETIDGLPSFYQKLFLEIRSWLVGVALTEYCGKSTKREDEEPATKLAIYERALMCNGFKYLHFFRFFLKDQDSKVVRPKPYRPYC